MTEYRIKIRWYLSDGRTVESTDVKSLSIEAATRAIEYFRMYAHTCCAPCDAWPIPA